MYDPSLAGTGIIAGSFAPVVGFLRDRYPMKQDIFLSHSPATRATAGDKKCEDDVTIGLIRRTD